MKTTNYTSKLKNTLAMLVVLGVSAIITKDAKAQFVIPDFSNFTFYTVPTGGEDLHYNYGWTRNGGLTQTSNVYVSGGKLIVRPTSGSQTNWFQTVPMSFDSNTNLITFSAGKTNNSSGTSTLNIYVIDTSSLVQQLVGSVNFSNASLNSNITFNVSAGIYWIRFEYNQSIGNGTSFLEFNNMTFSTTPVFLPVNYRSFAAEKSASNVILKWVTASETNNSHFEIERSTNGEEWTMLGTVNGSGNSSELISYEFIDMNPESGVNYYRLKQVDFNGDVYYSKLTEVIMNTVKSEQVKIYPNPAVSFVNIDVPSTVETVTTEIRTMDGRVIKSDTFSNTSKATVSVQDLIPGVYYMHIQMGSQTIVKSILKN